MWNGPVGKVFFAQISVGRCSHILPDVFSGLSTHNRIWGVCGDWVGFWSRA